MKFLIFAIVLAVAVAAVSLKDQQQATDPSQACRKMCKFDRDPHCACKTENRDACKEFPNKCIFEVFNCTSKDHNLLKKGKCLDEKHEIVAAPWCYKGCPLLGDPHCACRKTPVDNCKDVINKCVFEIFNCTTQDFVSLERGPCKKN